MQGGHRVAARAATNEAERARALEKCEQLVTATSAQAERARTRAFQCMWTWEMQQAAAGVSRQARSAEVLAYVRGVYKRPTSFNFLKLYELWKSRNTRTTEADSLHAEDSAAETVPTQESHDASEELPSARPFTAPVVDSLTELMAPAMPAGMGKSARKLQTKPDKKERRSASDEVGQRPSKGGRSRSQSLPPPPSSDEQSTHTQACGSSPEPDARPPPPRAGEMKTKKTKKTKVPLPERVLGCNPQLVRRRKIRSLPPTPDSQRVSPARKKQRRRAQSLPAPSPPSPDYPEGECCACWRVVRRLRKEHKLEILMLWRRIFLLEHRSGHVAPADPDYTSAMASATLQWSMQRLGGWLGGAPGELLATGIGAASETFRSHWSGSVPPPVGRARTTNAAARRPPPDLAARAAAARRMRQGGGK